MVIIWGFLFGVILIGVGRGFGSTSGTFSCRFEEMGHKVSWDSVLLMVGFLVFEFEILFILFLVLEGVMLIFTLIILIIILELLVQGFNV